MVTWVRWVAVAGAMAVASPAFALETGQCLPAQQVRTALAAENMQPIIVGNRTGYGYPTSLIFFANADGSRGYLIRGDRPLGQQAETACVDSVYRDIRLNDITRAGIPDWATVGGDPSIAQAACRRYRLGYQEQCQPGQSVLSSFEKHGTRLMFMATGTAINPRDKSLREDQRLIVLADPASQTGDIDAITTEGASYMLSAYVRVSYTQNANGMLAR